MLEVNGNETLTVTEGVEKGESLVFAASSLVQGDVSFLFPSSSFSPLQQVTFSFHLHRFCTCTPHLLYLTIVVKQCIVVEYLDREFARVCIESHTIYNGQFYNFARVFEYNLSSTDWIQDSSVSNVSSPSFFSWRTDRRTLTHTLL